MNLLIIKNTKLLYEFFAFNNKYMIYGSYAIWEFIRNNNNVAHDSNRDYLIYMLTFKITCDTNQDMMQAFYFIKWYFSNIEVIVDQEHTRLIIHIDTLISVILSVKEQMMIEASDLLYIDHGVVKYGLCNTSSRRRKDLDSFARFETTLLMKIVSSEKEIREMSTLIIKRARFWDSILGFPFIIVNVMSNDWIVGDCLNSVCGICTNKIVLASEPTIALIANCCHRKFHLDCLEEYCLNSHDCYKCQSNGKYNFMLKLAETVE